MLCYCVLHVLNHFVQWNWCIKAMCSTVVCLQFYCVVRFSLCRSQWNGSARLLEGHLFSSKFMAKLYYFIIIPPKSRRFGGMISLTDQRSLCPGWSRATMPCLPKNAMGFSRDLRDNCLLLSPVASGKSKKMSAHISLKISRLMMN